MSEMKLIMERWDKYLVEEENGITIGDFLDGMMKFMPGPMQKIVGSKAFKWIVTIGGTSAAAIAAVTAAPAVGAAAAGAAIAGNITVGWLIDKIAGSGDDIAKMIAAQARKQVPDDKRDGLALYYDIDDGYERMIGGINSKLGNEFINDGLYVEYSTAFTRIKSDKAAIGDNDPAAMQAYLDQPLSAIGINKTANQLFKDMLKGEDGMSLPSMGNRKVDATPIA